jgi:tRNA pseudouridine38-40 synthase
MPTRTLKLTLAYDGTRLVGWQRQAEGDSAQAWLEDALARFEGAPVVVHGAGRTDAGVHALGQVASVSLTSAHDPETLLRALNAQLPPDLRVLRVEETRPEFHARFDARRKTYRYLMRNASWVHPLEHRYVWHVPQPLDLEAMRTAAAQLVGTHDFAAFQSAGGDVLDSVRTVLSSRVDSPSSSPVTVFGAGGAVVHSGPLLSYEIEGTGFLRHMVRAVVGTLVEVGRGWRAAESMAELVAGKCRQAAGATAPPEGLFLLRVDYD